MGRPFRIKAADAMFVVREEKKMPNMTATTNSKLEIHRLDDKRYALTLDGFVRYVGTQEECERRAVILGHKNDRATQDKALARLVNLIR